MQELFIQARHEIRAKAGDLLIIDPAALTVRVVGNLAAYPAALKTPEQLPLTEPPQTATLRQNGTVVDPPAAPAAPIYSRARRVQHRRTHRQQDEDRLRVIAAIGELAGEFYVSDVVKLVYPNEDLAWRDHRAHAGRDDLRVLDEMNIVERVGTDAPLKYRVLKSPVPPPPEAA